MRKKFFICALEGGGGKGWGVGGERKEKNAKRKKKKAYNRSLGTLKIQILFLVLFGC
jgi:hypothetical protein